MCRFEAVTGSEKEVEKVERTGVADGARAGGRCDSVLFLGNRASRRENKMTKTMIMLFPSV